MDVVVYWPGYARNQRTLGTLLADPTDYDAGNCFHAIGLTRYLHVLEVLADIIFHGPAFCVMLLVLTTK